MMELSTGKCELCKGKMTKLQAKNCRIAKRPYFCYMCDSNAKYLMANPRPRTKTQRDLKLAIQAIYGRHSKSGRHTKVPELMPPTTSPMALNNQSLP